MVSLDATPAQLCTGNQVTYTTTIKNNGPGNVSGAPYRFTFPAELTGVTVTNSITGNGSIVSDLKTGTAYTASVNLNNNAMITFTIQGTVSAVPSGGSMNVNSAIMRIADYTDPDATNPNVAVPTDYQDECDASPSGLGCNNIKQRSQVVTQAPTVAVADIDQTLCAVTSATISANTPVSGVGTWSIVANSAGSPMFSNVSAPSTTVSGLTPGTYTFRWNISSGGGCVASTDDIAVLVQPALSDNTTAPPTPSMFCGNSDPLPVTGSLPQGGSGSYVYRWQQSADNVTFTDISAANSKDFDPGVLNSTTYYRRAVTSGSCTTPIFSNVSTVVIQPALSGNTITAPTAVVFCGSGDPAAIAGAIATGGNGTIAYQWQSSSDNVTFYDIPAANGRSYDPGAQTSTVYFRREVTSGTCTPVYSNVVAVTINPLLSSGTINANQIFCGSGNPDLLTELSPASGGNGSYTYTWQVSTTSAVSGFTNIPSASAPNYDPATISTNTYYRRVVNSSVCASEISNVVTVTVNPAVTAGTVSANQTFCSSGNPVNFEEVTAPSGGDGTFAYQWESSANNVTFTAIAAATLNTYDAPTINKTTYYRRTVSSATCPQASSNVITVTITNAIGGNSIGGDQTICYNTTPATITGANATGGSGGFTYLWESSTTDLSGFGPAAGANSAPSYSPGPLTQNTLFRRTITSGICGSVQSTVTTVYVSQLPTVSNAGPDQGPLTAGFTSFAGNVPTTGNGVWTLITGPNIPVILNPTQANSSITGLVPGTYTFRWTIGNPPCVSSTDEMIIRVNIPPVANTDNTTTAEDNQVIIPVSSNDTDVDGTINKATVVIITPPGKGTVTVNADGTVTYKPNLNYNGTDFFTYTIKDNLGGISNVATVNINVTPVNDPPVAVDDRVNALEDTEFVLLAPGVLSNDIDPDGQVLTTSLVKDVKHGTLVFGADGSFKYTPALDFVGLDTFSYKVCDPFGICDTGLVIIDVGDGNDPPKALPDAYTAYEDSILIVNVPGVQANDSDPDGDPIDVSLNTSTTHGTITLFGNGSFIYYPFPDFYGTDEFEYKACDAGGSCASAKVTITVININDRPKAINKNYAVNEDATLAIIAPGILTGCTDADPSDILTTALITPTLHGTIAVSPSGAFTYKPDADYYGVDQFVYRLCDNGTPMLCDSAVITLTINPVNDAPVALNDDYTMIEDGTLTVPAPGVQSNDSDKEGDLLTSTVVTTTKHGTLTLQPNGRFVYVPIKDFAGKDSFTYKVCDAGGACALAVARIVVTPVNDKPNAVNNSYSVLEDNILTVAPDGVLSNDVDPDGDPLTATLVAGVTHGTLTLNSNGGFTYVPFPDYNGTDQFRYNACDPLGLCSTAVVNIRVNPVSDYPIGASDNYTMEEDSTLTVFAPGVLGNDKDPDIEVITALVKNPPSSGTLSLNADGSFVYKPFANYFGTDRFSYWVCDAGGLCDTAVVNITINPHNDTPLAGDVTYSTNEDQTLTVNAPGVMSNSSDADGDVLTVTAISQPLHGTLTLNATGGFVYVPAANFFGTDFFNVKVCDLSNACANAVVTINVIPFNDIPVTGRDEYTTNEDVVLNRSNPGVLINDTDADGDALSASIFTQPKHGTITIDPQGGFVYTPDIDYFGLDSVIYQACDAFGGCALGTALITILPVNDAPRSLPDTYTINEDDSLSLIAPGLMFNDLDPDGDNITVSLSAAPSKGVASVKSDGSFTYKPNANYNGTDSFKYRVCDSGNPSLCTIETVTIIIKPVNDAPDAKVDVYTLAEDVPLTVLPKGVLTNDVDLEGDVLTARVVKNPLNGVLSLSANGGFVYVPNADYNGTDVFVYEACDPSGACDTASVYLTITPVNDPPKATDDYYSTAEEVTLVVGAPGLLFNDSDPEGNTISASLINVPAHGTALVNANGSFTYIPNPNYSGPDSYTYRTTDAFGAFTDATAYITVIPVNDNPIAVADSFSVAEDNVLHIAPPGILQNDTDVDGDVLTVTSIGTQPLHGTVILSSDGAFDYTPNTNFFGTDTWTYLIQDGNGGTATGSVKIVVTPVNDDPITLDDSYTVNEDNVLNVNAPGVLFNDTDPDVEPLTVVSNTNPANGVLVISPNGKFIYTPAANYNGTDSFTYTVSDGHGGTSTSTVTIVVLPMNDRPVAGDDFYAVDEDNILDVPASGVLANDIDPDADALTVFNVIVQPTHGILAWLPNGSFKYTPAVNFFGTDNFTYVVSDGHAGLDTAVVIISVKPVDDMPLATNDDFTVNSNVTLNVPAPGVLFNDREFDGDVLTVIPIISQVGTGAGGTLTINADGSLTYIPAGPATYIEQFTYTIKDANGNTATAVATFHVGHVNNKPIAADDNYTGTEDITLVVSAPGVLSNDRDPDDPIGVNNLGALLLTQLPLHGTVTLYPDGSFIYVPNHDFYGSDFFEYSADDANGAKDTARVNIIITPV
ncbi:MAG: Ig-like domain-containing protein, partial [Bacteroidota bacterium]